MDKVEKYRYWSMLTWWLIMHENIFYQHQNDLLDETLYSGWAGDLEKFVVDQKLWQLWDEMKGLYHGDFEKNVSRLVEKNRPQKTRSHETDN